MIELIICLVMIPAFALLSLIYLILFGGKECYFCGTRLNEQNRALKPAQHVCKACMHKWVK